MELPLTFLGVSLAALTILAWHITNSLWLKPKKLEQLLRKQGFNGNPYRPIHGDAADITRLAQSALSKPIPTFSHDILSRLMPFELQIIQHHGKKSFVWYGRKPKVTIAQPELIRKILAQYEVFRKQPPRTRTNFGLVMRDGDDWAKVRRIINPAFHMEKLKNMLPLMEVSCNMMLQKWEEKVSSKGSCEIDVFSCLREMAADVIARTAFGSSYEHGKTLFLLEDQSIILKFQRMRSLGNYIPGWRYLPSKINRKIRALDKETERVVKSLIDNRKRAMKGGSDAMKDDLLSIMLESNEREKEEHGAGLPMEELITECRLFLLAGKDTVASLLTWTMLLLSLHQDWQSKARDEVLQLFRESEHIDFDQLIHLKITSHIGVQVTMILYETLRFYPPVTGISRVMAHDTSLSNLSLTQDMEVSLPTLLVHRDTQIWGDDANEFNPARFSQGISNASNVSGSFFPFGGGPRICIGQHFALIEAKLTLAKIIRHFSFHLSPTYVHAPITLVGMVPQFGAPLIFRKV